MIGSKPSINYKVIAISFIVAYLLGVTPLPLSAQHFRPEWVIMVLIFWSMQCPDKISVGAGWGVGLLQDSLRGVLLGQNALTYALIAYLTVQLHQRMKLFPMWQQSFLVFLLICLNQAISMWVQGLTGVPSGVLNYLLPALTSMCIWPMVQFILSECMTRKIKVM